MIYAYTFILVLLMAKSSFDSNCIIGHKAVNREDILSRRYRDRDLAKFESSRRYRER
jgi:hypothetical protein